MEEIPGTIIQSGWDGAYVTSVDIFFAEVEDPAVPWWVEIRTMEVDYQQNNWYLPMLELI